MSFIRNIKKVIRYIITGPQIVRHWIRLGHIRDYDHLTSFFRHFPFASITRDNIVTFYFDKQKVTMDCGDLPPVSLTEAFAREEYKRVLIKGRDVVDVGAAFGDTTVYFALKGARKVYGYEIVSRTYKLAEHNIKLNHLENICSVELCGIGNGEPISANHLMLGACMHKNDRSQFNGIQTKTLKQVVQEKSIDNGVLKIDVDGFEYEIIGNADSDTLRKFCHIILEYHFGVKDLLAQLKNAGFETQVIKTANVYVDYHPHGYQNMDIGYIVATRNDAVSQI